MERGRGKVEDGGWRGEREQGSERALHFDKLSTSDWAQDRQGSMGGRVRISQADLHPHLQAWLTDKFNISTDMQ